MLLGCGSEAAPRRLAKVRPMLIHPLFFQEEIATQLNFPFWFNDSILRANHTQQISWTIFSTFESGPGQNGDTETFPKTTLVYTFSPEGKLLAIERTDYSEGIVIARKKYAIAPGTGSPYAEVSMVSPVNPDNEERPESYLLLKKKNMRRNVQQYDDVYSESRYHFFPDRKFWGPLSIDSIGHPGTQDWIICGTPEKPLKRYQVRNTVNEKNVTLYTYFNDNYPEMTTWSDYPFTQKRYFSYSHKGIFTGYIDSSFSDSLFITRTVTAFSFDTYNRPAKITHEKGHAEGEASYRTIEQITYIPFSRQ
jgi:hypothetical protein